MKSRPERVIILGKEYSITYTDNPASVDIHKRNSLWGQIDFWTRSIRVYDTPHFSWADIIDTLLHEILHGIVNELKLAKLADDEEVVGLLALGLADTLIRNGWITEEAEQGSEG